MRTSTVFLALVLVSVPLAGCLQQAGDLVASRVAADPAGPVLDEAGFVARMVDGYVYSTFDAVTEAGFTVHAEVYLPDPALALPGVALPETFPAVLLASPYNGAGYGEDIEFGYGPYDFLVNTLLPRGYAIVVGDSAAMGGSGGCWDFMGPQDQASAVALVEAIAQQPWSNGKVGMMGLSYDAMTQIMASTGAAPHLVTVVPAAPLTHAYAGLYMNGVHYGGGWMATTTMYTQSGLAPPGQNAERYPGWVDSVTKAPPCAAETTVHGNDPTGAYNAWYAERDFRPEAANVSASVFYIQGFLDAAVKPDNAFPWFNDVTAPKKAWLGHWFHQYPIAQNAGRDDLYLTLARWFDRWLYDVPNGIDDELRVDVMDSQGRWRHEATWPPADATTLTLHLRADATLAQDAGEAGTLSTGGPAGIARQLALADGSSRAVVTSAPLEAPLHIAGMPRLDLVVASDRPGGQVVATLWELGGDAPRLVSRGAFNLMLHDDITAASPLTPGVPVSVSFDLYPTDYVVDAGRQLELRLETTDTTLWYHADPWLSTLTVSVGGDAASFLTLPLVERDAAAAFHVGCGRPIAAFVDCYDEDLEDKEVGA